jgi:putative ABC transport system permease protein
VLSRTLLVGRLAGRDLRHRPAQAVLLLLAITAATATLTLGLALHGVTSQPYQQTRAATNGPDVVAQLSSAAVRHQPGQANPGPQILAQVNALVHGSGVTGHSGPYPLAGAIVAARGLTAQVEVEGRSQAPASLDQPKVTAGGWVRGGGVVLERTFAEALGVGVGDRITLNGRPFRVTGSRSPPPCRRIRTCAIRPAVAATLPSRTRSRHWARAPSAWPGPPSRMRASSPRPTRDRRPTC